MIRIQEKEKASEALVELVILVLFAVAESDDRYKRLQARPRMLGASSACRM